MSFTDLLIRAKAYVSEDFRVQYERLFAEEHLSALADCLLRFYSLGVPDRMPSPSFKEEVTPSLHDSFAYFLPALQLWVEQKADEAEAVTTLAEAMEDAGISHILLLLGQRRTPGSLTDASAIPPLKADLLRTASVVYSEGLTAAARAWTKHTNRSVDLFWGRIEGGNERKNEIAEGYIQMILNEKTWWNVFFHYKHQVVYEARIATGHGARWGRQGEEFIGFLEPFLEESV